MRTTNGRWRATRQTRPGRRSAFGRLKALRSELGAAIPRSRSLRCVRRKEAEQCISSRMSRPLCRGCTDGFGKAQLRRPRVSAPPIHIPGFDGPMTTIGRTGRSHVGGVGLPRFARIRHCDLVARWQHDGLERAGFLGRGNGVGRRRSGACRRFPGRRLPRVPQRQTRRASLVRRRGWWARRSGPSPSLSSGVEAASSPTLLIVGDRLIVAYRTARGVGLTQLPTLGIAK